MKNQPIIYAGQYQNKLYGEFQEQIDMFNRAFAEVMLEGMPPAACSHFLYQPIISLLILIGTIPFTMGFGK